MRAKGIFVQRIESGETGKGIPDLFIITRRTPMWIELKRVHGACHRDYVEIPWRPGQQAWLTDVANRGVICYTIACFNDGILKIPHRNTLWNKNLVPVQACEYYSSIKELLG